MPILNNLTVNEIGTQPSGTISITSDGTYDVTNYATASVSVGGSTGKYSLFQQVTDDSNNVIGTVAGFHTDGNGNEYAIVVLHSGYQENLGYYDALPTSQNQYLTPITDLSVYDSTETATANTTATLNDATVFGVSAPAATAARSMSYVIDNVTYYGQIPTMKELMQILLVRTALNTAAGLTLVTLTPIFGFWSSSCYSNTTTWRVTNQSLTNHSSKNVKDPYSIITILELPNA